MAAINFDENYIKSARRMDGCEAEGWVTHIVLCMLWIMGDVVNADQFESVTIFRMPWVRSRLRVQAYIYLLYNMWVRKQCLQMITQWTLNSPCSYIAIAVAVAVAIAIVIVIQQTSCSLSLWLLRFYVVSRCLNASYDFILWSMKALLGYHHGYIVHENWKRTFSGQ